MKNKENELLQFRETNVYSLAKLYLLRKGRRANTIVYIKSAKKRINFPPKLRNP